VRVLVVYESMFGNTREVATAIADGIAGRLPVETIEVADAPVELPQDVGLLVVGGPTHAHGMTTSATRADAANRAGERLVSHGQGVREWLDALRPGLVSIPGAAFDTRIHGPEVLWGSAAKGIAKRLASLGLKPVRAESFKIGGPTGPLFDRLSDEERQRARTWGAELAATLGAPVAV